MTPIRVGSWEKIIEGGRASILAVGAMVETARAVSVLLAAAGHEVGVVNCRFIKPMDLEMLRELARDQEILVTLEENSLRGGFGTGVYEALAEAGVTAPRLLHLGLPDRFIEHGSREGLLADLGLSPEGIASTIRAALEAPARDHRSA
jgi:1-deoxy-D-xylulose-5-phosphate synthase